jgi:CAAX protease family protein
MTSLREALRSLDRRVAVICLASALLAPTWYFFLRVACFERIFGTETGHGVARDLLPPAASFTAMFGILAVLPAILVVRVFGDRLRDYGLGLGDVRYGLRATLLTAPFFLVPTAIGGLRMPQMAAVYPLSRAALASTTHFVAYEALYLVFYLAWEFHFRGFILLGAEKALGAWPAIGLSVVTTGLMHLVKPTGEFYSSVFAGVVWGWIVVRTRSILWPLLMHYAVGVTNDVTLAIHFHHLRFGG